MLGLLSAVSWLFGAVSWLSLGFGAQSGASQGPACWQH